MTTTAAADLRSLIDTDLPRATEVRRDLHAHPELMFKEERTAKVVQDELRGAGVEFAAGLARGTGVLGYLPATGDPGSARTIGLRADMDALPITEDTGVPYASTNTGVMHACGHDAHTAILAATARVLSRAPERPNNVVFIFQPAEEGGAGGDLMVKDGALDGSAIGTPVDQLYGLHGWPMFPLGHLSTRPGPVLASCDEFWATINGRGGHAAMHHLTVDPVVAAAHIVTSLQTIVSRNVDPAHGRVLSVTDISTPNDATNVVPPCATIRGTVRTLDEHDRAVIRDRFHAVVTKTAEALGCTAEITYKSDYPVTANDPGATERFFEIARTTFGEQRVGVVPEPCMGAEDFSFYCQKVPACFFLIGLDETGEGRMPGLHTPQFDFNDKALPTAIEAMCRLALTPLN
ncbi:MAG: amidohydrolase [Planctomycetota bacterium]